MTFHPRIAFLKQGRIIRTMTTFRSWRRKIMFACNKDKYKPIWNAQMLLMSASYQRLSSTAKPFIWEVKGHGYHHRPTVVLEKLEVKVTYVKRFSPFKQAGGPPLVGWPPLFILHIHAHFPHPMAASFTLDQRTLHAASENLQMHFCRKLYLSLIISKIKRETNAP